MDDSTPIIDVTPHPADFVPRDDFWAFLRRRKGLVFFFWMLGLTAAFWWLFSRPEVFEAESRVMIVRTGAGGPVSESELASELELINDPSHIDKVVARQLLGASDTELHLLRLKIESALKVAPAGKSNLVTIQFRDHDPTAAARIVNQLVDLYLAERRSIFLTGGRPSGDPPGPAQDLLSTFDALNHGSQLRSELQSRLQRRVDSESRVAERKAQLREHQETAVSLRKKLATVPDVVHSRTRTRISDSPAGKQTEETEIANPLKQQIESQLLTNESAIAGLKARLEQDAQTYREAQIAEDRTSSLLSERDKIERRALEARGSIDYTLASERSNLRANLINRADPPYAPLPRYTLLWTPAAILAALLLALVIAWFFDQFDKPIYTSSDLEDASGAPPMGNFSRGAGA